MAVKSKTIILRADPERLLKVSRKAGKLLFQPEAEKSILQLLEYQEKVEEAIKIVKEAIAQAGEDMLPGFKGVQSGKVRVMNRVYGSKYSFSGGVPADEGFLKTKEITTIDSDAVDAYIKEMDKMPEGIEANKRDPQISITLIEKKAGDKNV